MIDIEDLLNKLKNENSRLIDEIKEFIKQDLDKHYECNNGLYWMKWLFIIQGQQLIIDKLIYVESPKSYLLFLQTKQKYLVAKSLQSDLTEKRKIETKAQLKLVHELINVMDGDEETIKRLETALTLDLKDEKEMEKNHDTLS